MTLDHKSDALAEIDAHLTTLRALYERIPEADEVTIRPFWPRWAVEHTLAEYRCVLLSLIHGLEQGRRVVEASSAESGPILREDLDE